MGVDINGSMIVGNYDYEISVPEEWMEENEDGELYEYAEECDMDSMNPYYDAQEDIVFGFKVEDVAIGEMDKWLDDIETKAAKFEKLTGAKAMLIGMQNVW